MLPFVAATCNSGGRSLQETSARFVSLPCTCPPSDRPSCEGSALDPVSVRRLDPGIARRPLGQDEPQDPQLGGGGELLEGKLLPFCETHGYDILKHLDVDVLRKFRASWPYAPLSARKRLEYLRSFFRFCQDSGWVDRNPAMAVKSSKAEQNPTLPFSDDEVERVLVAARALTGFGQYGPKIEPMVLLLRYSGLRIQDAACLVFQTV